MAPAPNESTPQSPNGGEATPDGISTDGDRVSPGSGTTPPLPDVEPITVDAAAKATPEPELSESEPSPEISSDSENATSESAASENATDDAPAAASSSTVTFEDIAPVAETAPAPEPVTEPEPMAEPEPVAEPESVVEPESVADPESAVEPEPVAEPKPVVEPESAVEPEPAPESTAVADPTPTPRPSPPKAPTTPSPAKPPTAAPTASAGTVQRIWGLLRPPLVAAAKTVLATGVKGANWLTQQLEAAPPAPESSQTGILGILTGVWRIVKPLLVAVTLSLSRLFNQLLQWSLERLDPEVKAAVAAESSRTAFLITSATLALLFFLGGSLINPSPATPETTGSTPAAAVRSAPNQARLDAMQAQISGVVERYNGTVYAVDLDAIGDRLTVTLDDGWYRLSENQRQRFARQLQREASNAKFPQLTLLNERGERLARTPVVGDDMVLFQTPTPPPPPEVPDTLDSPSQAPETELEAANNASTVDSASPAAVSLSPSSPAEPAQPE